MEGTEQIIPIDKIIVHPKYDPHEGNEYDYDVALIKLRDAINFTSSVRPVLLPTMDFPPETNCYVTGWGSTKKKGNISLVNILIFQSFADNNLPLHLYEPLYKRIGKKYVCNIYILRKIPKRQLLFSHVIDTVHINVQPYVHFY